MDKNVVERQIIARLGNGNTTVEQDGRSDVRRGKITSTYPVQLLFRVPPTLHVNFAIVAVVGRWTVGHGWCGPKRM